MPPGPLFALYVELDLRRRGQLDLMAGRKVCGLPHSWMASMVSRRNPYETGTKPGLDQNIPTRPDRPNPMPAGSGRVGNHGGLCLLLRSPPQFTS